MHEVMTIAYWRKKPSEELERTLRHWNDLVGGAILKKKDLIRQVLNERLTNLK